MNRETTLRMLVGGEENHSEVSQAFICFCLKRNIFAPLLHVNDAEIRNFREKICLQMLHAPVGSQTRQHHRKGQTVVSVTYRRLSRQDT